MDREAADWVARKIRGFSGKEQDAFFEWLAADPHHGEWYAKHQKTWRELDMLAHWLPEHSELPNQDLLKHKVPKPQRYWVGGIAAALTLGFVSLFVFPIPRGPEIESTNFVANSYESHELPDGSVVELNQGAALKVNYTKAVRWVELVSSEAHFDVVKDVDRPFIVRVRGFDIRAVGTAFNVRLKDQSVQVIVTEGKVQVIERSPENFAQDESIYDDSLYRQDLVVGQMTEVSLLPPEPSSDGGFSREIKDVSLGEMNELLSWKPQMFIFDSTPLSEVIDEFNSRNKTHLVIGDAKLAGLPIVASFRSADVEHFVELLQLSVDLEVERQGTHTIILKSPR